MNRNVIIILLALLLFPLFSTKANAYDLKVESFHENVVTSLRYYVDESASDRGLGPNISSAVYAWNNNSPYIHYYGGVLREQSAQQRFFSSNTDKGSIVATNRNYTDISGKRTNYSIIYTWRSFYSLTTSNKNETIAHEIGHSLGLNHENTKYSIMLERGFIGRTNPTTDDLNGIKAKYQ